MGPMPDAGSRHRKCQFPMWGSDETTGEFCGEPVVKGSYCQRHYEKCWLLPRAYGATVPVPRKFKS